MTVNNVVLDDYIIIPPQIGETWIQYIESQFGIIKICSNVVLQLDKIISSKHVTNSSLSYGGTIHAIVDVRLFSDLGIYRFPPQGGYIRMYNIIFQHNKSELRMYLIGVF